MTHPTTSPAPAGNSTADVAKQQAGDVAAHAGDAGRRVAQAAGDEAKDVMRDASRQARDLWDETRRELTTQSSQQQRRAADGLRSLGGELRDMSRQGTQHGVASDLAGQAADRVERAATWLGEREPGDVVDDVKRFARRNPMLFLGIAAGIGLVAGRATRSLADDKRGVDDPPAPAATATSRPADPGAHVRPAGLPQQGGVLR